MSLFVGMLLLGIGLFVISFLFKQSYLYILGSITIFFTGVAPLIFDGLLVNRVITGFAGDTIQYELVTLLPTDALMILISLVLCGIGFAALLVMSTNQNAKPAEARTFHY